MPVTAKLSKAFDDRLGEDIANELVNWFNQVDATYRSDLREVNELNYARFDAKLEQRFAQSDAKLEQRFAQSDSKLELRLISLRDELKSEFAAIRTELALVNARLEGKVDRGELEAALRKQTWLMVGTLATIFVGTIIPIIGLWLK
jgi:hypothetical protein